MPLHPSYNNYKIPSALTVLGLLLLWAWSINVYAARDEQYIAVGTGGVTGVYYPAGGAICRLVNRGRNDHGFRCSTESTAGGIYNLNALREGDIDLGIAQSDSVYKAVRGIDEFESSGGDGKLRSVFSAYTEPFTLVVRADSGIDSLDDMKGKRVNIGEKGAGQRSTLDALMKVKGWDKEDFSATIELKASEQAAALCAGDIDVMIYMIGHPSGAIKEVTTSCDSRLIALDEKVIEAMLAGNDYFEKAVIPGGMYRGNDKPIATFGVGATMLASSDMPDQEVYAVVKAVFEQFEIFQKLHPALAGLNKKQMVSEGLIAPIHPGALRYYNEVGLVKE